MPVCWFAHVWHLNLLSFSVYLLFFVKLTENGNTANTLSANSTQKLVFYCNLSNIFTPNHRFCLFNIYTLNPFDSNASFHSSSLPFRLSSVSLTHTKASVTAWKVSKHGVFAGPYSPAFGLNTERHFISLSIQSECGKIRTRKNSLSGHISLCEYKAVLLGILT